MCAAVNTLLRHLVLQVPRGREEALLRVGLLRERGPRAPTIRAKGSPSATTDDAPLTLLPFLLGLERVAEAIRELTVVCANHLDELRIVEESRRSARACSC